MEGAETVFVFAMFCFMTSATAVLVRRDSTLSKCWLWSDGEALDMYAEVDLDCALLLLVLANDLYAETSPATT